MIVHTLYSIYKGPFHPSMPRSVVSRLDWGLLQLSLRQQFQVSG